MSAIAPFTLLLRVRYGECDAQDVVFNARYGDYADIAMNEFLRTAIGGYDTLRSAEMDIQVVRLATDFLAPAKFDEILAITVETSSIGNTSFALTIKMYRYPSGSQIATTEVTYVLVTAKKYQKLRVPDEMRALLQAGAPGAIVNHAGVVLDTQ